MAVSEWGPKSVQKQSGSLREVTRFPSGAQLQEAGARVSLYLEMIPGSTRDQAIADLAKNSKDASRMDAALGVLNQLSILNRNGNDVRSVIVREDPRSPIARTGLNHHFYEIDWIRKPDDASSHPDKRAQGTSSPIRDQRVQTPPSGDAAKGVIYSFKTGGEQGTERRGGRYSRSLDKEEKRRKREEKRATELAEQERKQKRQAVDDVVIDKVREEGEAQVKFKNIKIGINEEGKAVFREYLGSRYDEDTEWGARMRSYMNRFKPEYLQYYNFLAERAEGNPDAKYTPPPLDTQTCISTFEKARELGMIRLRKGDQGVVFEYEMEFDPLGLAFGKEPEYTYRPIDLEQGTVNNGNILSLKIRPLHPDFTSFLKTLKARLDAPQGS